jgi:hypothetical protein
VPFWSDGEANARIADVGAVSVATMETGIVVVVAWKIPLFPYCGQPAEHDTQAMRQ